MGAGVVSNETKAPAMHNNIDIDDVHSRAIVREIGEKLRASLKPEPELPANLKSFPMRSIGKKLAVDSQMSRPNMDEQCR